MRSENPEAARALRGRGLVLAAKRLAVFGESLTGFPVLYEGLGDYRREYDRGAISILPASTIEDFIVSHIRLPALAAK